MIPCAKVIPYWLKFPFLKDLLLHGKTKTRSERRHFTQPGTYTYRLLHKACTYSGRLQIEQITPPSPLPKDTSHCSSVTLGVSNTAYSFEWNTSETSSTLSTTASGTYWRKASQPPCVFTDTCQVLIYQDLPDAQLDTALCEGEQLRLELDTLPYLFIDQNPAFIDKTGILQLNTYDGCDSNTLTIETTQKQNCACFLYMPTAFSPNDDGLNDTLRPLSNCQLIHVQLQVFNRWGQRIYQGADPWLGQGALPNGLYVYRIEAFVTNGGREFPLL